MGHQLAQQQGSSGMPRKDPGKALGIQAQAMNGQEVAHILLQCAQTGQSESVSSNESYTSSLDPATSESFRIEEKCRIDLRTRKLLQ